MSRALGVRGRRWVWILFGAVGVALVVLYAMVDPATHLFPRCIFLQLTGLKCPGCGSQRALHALLCGDVASAWGYNPALLVGGAVIAVLLSARILRSRYPRFYNLTEKPIVAVAVMVAIVVWWALRNVYGW